MKGTLSAPATQVSEQELLLARAERLRLHGSRQQEAAVTWVAEFPHGGSMWALPLESLRMALNIRAVSAVPLAPPPVIGIVRFEGRLLCAYSLATVLGVSEWRQDPAVVLIIDLGDRMVAVDCDRVPRAVPLPTHAVEQGRVIDGGARREILVEGREPLTLLDLNKLLTRERNGDGA